MIYSNVTFSEFIPEPGEEVEADFDDDDERGALENDLIGMSICDFNNYIICDIYSIFSGTLLAQIFIFNR